jgi:hypothetical protein
MKLLAEWIESPKPNDWLDQDVNIRPVANHKRD